MHHHRVRTLLLRIGLPLALVVTALAFLLSTPPSSQAGSYRKVFLPLTLKNYVPLGNQTNSRLGVWIGGGDSATAARLAESGARWTRVTLNWSTVEPVRDGDYHFESYDALFQSLAQQGVTPVVEIRGNPTWAATTPCGPIDGPAGLSRFDAFVRATVGHYSVAPYGVHNWEFYNEPDNTDKVKLGPAVGGCFGNHPAEYKAMLQTAYPAVHATDSNGKVLLGALAFDYYKDPAKYPNCNADNCFNPSFLDQLLSAGGGAYFDVANVHTFSSHNQTPRNDTPIVARFWGNGFDIAGKIETLRQVMSSHGVTKPVMVSELSWTSSGDLELQARYVPKALARGLAANLYAMTWFNLQDDQSSYDWDAATVKYGLIDKDGNRRDSYTAFRTAAIEFGNSTGVRKLAASEVGVSGSVEGYVFTVDGRERWVLWARADGQPDGSGTVIGVHLPSNTAVYDKLGTKLGVSTAGANYRLDDQPIYVER